MKANKSGIPYMGGKRAISKPIIDFILWDNPKCEYFYDLFGGGGSMSFEALQRPQIKTVFYNEIDTSIVELIKKIRDDGITDEFYKWIPRAEFHALKNGTCWRSGLVKIVWSFGSNWKKGYLFSQKNEELKQLLHEFIVNKSLEAITDFYLLTDIEIAAKLIDHETINKRRLAIRKFMIANGRLDIKQLQQLERLQQLQQLERLQQLEQLELSNKSYQDVKITTPIDKTVIYLDPPYINTEKYQSDICHNALYDYIVNSPYKIYLSSYKSHLPCVFEISKRSSLSPTNNNKKVTERLFTNATQ